MSKLLMCDPARRYTAQQVVHDEFFAQHARCTSPAVPSGGPASTRDLATVVPLSAAEDVGEPKYGHPFEFGKAGKGAN